MVRIADCISNISHRQARELQEFGCLCHAVVYEKFLRGFPHTFMKNFSEVAAVQPNGSGNILHGNIILKILFNKGKCLFDIKIAQTAAPADLGRGGGADRDL